VPWFQFPEDPKRAALAPLTASVPDVAVPVPVIPAIVIVPPGPIAAVGWIVKVSVFAASRTVDDSDPVLLEKDCAQLAPGSKRSDRSDRSDMSMGHLEKEEGVSLV
jgi:hypothetical protein